ncbi:hypothetical protein ACQKFS_18615 [Pseudomonas guineae]|uniref:hypothetical protein n=1 Tax=Pseudomonas guineae TaxID=425504 RepID=UPI003D04B48D
MPTGWRPQDVRERPWPKMTEGKFQSHYPAALKAYAFVQVVGINLLALGFLLSVKNASVLEPWLLSLMGLLLIGARSAPGLDERLI